MQKHILIIEDDKSVADGVKDILTTCDYQVSWAKNSAQTMHILEKERIHLIILDICLDGESGYDICREIRTKKQTPILFLTACSSETELIRGFQSGGDDYVIKPFRVKELIVRIEALLRRASIQKTKIHESGDLLFDREAQQVKKDGKAVELTATEWKLAALLLASYPDALTREELLYQVWDKEALYVEENTLSVNISRLREKIGKYEGQTYIETVRSVGYRWTVPVKQ